MGDVWGRQTRFRAVADRFDKLAPRDLVITLRSLRRRFGGLASRAALDAAVMAAIDAPDGAEPSLRGRFEQAAQAAALVENELSKALDHDDPVVAAAALDASERHFLDVPGTGMSPAQAVDALADDAERAADRLESAAATELTRAVRVAGGGTTTPAALGAELARTEIGALSAIEDLLDRLAG